MTGGTVSLKVMVCTQLAVFPQPSVAVHVRKIVPLPVQSLLTWASTKLMLAMPLHASVAVAKPVLFVVGATVHSRMELVGQVMIGGVVSLKVIVCRQRLRLPQASRALQVRRIAALPVQLVLPGTSTKLMFVTA